MCVYICVGISVCVHTYAVSVDILAMFLSLSLMPDYSWHLFTLPMGITSQKQSMTHIHLHSILFSVILVSDGIKFSAILFVFLWRNFRIIYYLSILNDILFISITSYFLFLFLDFFIFLFSFFLYESSFFFLSFPTLFFCTLIHKHHVVIVFNALSAMLF